MAKVIATIVPEDGTKFEDILSFETENYIGVWNQADSGFMLISRTDSEFYARHITAEHETLLSLDDDVYHECGEHITDVYDSSAYIFSLKDSNCSKGAGLLDVVGKGCEHCLTEYGPEDWRDGNKHDIRIEGRKLYTYRAPFGWEGTAIKFCPWCGRILEEQ